MNFSLKIWRQKDAKSKGAFKTYRVENISPDTSFLEMLDILNNNLVHAGEEPVAFDHDCRDEVVNSEGSTSILRGFLGSRTQIFTISAWAFFDLRTTS